MTRYLSQTMNQVQAEEMERMGPKIKFAVYASFTVNFCLFVIQMYAAISTGSLALFATAADAFVSQSHDNLRKMKLVLTMK